jgi:hypothetical protein
MTEKELCAFEARYRSNLRISLSWEEMQSLTAEIRRSWREIEHLRKRDAALKELEEGRAVVGRTAPWEPIPLTDGEKQILGIAVSGRDVP